MDHNQLMLQKVAFIKEIRGQGLLNWIECDPDFSKKVSAWDVCMRLKEAGLLAKPTHDNIIRFAPPLVISKNQLETALLTIKKTFFGFSDIEGAYVE